MLPLNFISLAVSVFISNYIFMYIIRLLPIKNKRIVQLVVISLADIGSIIGYIINLFSMNFELVIFLYTLGNIIGIGVAYVASLMLILDNVQIFKSKRAREFERGINNKEGSSVPRYILAGICLGITAVLLAYGIINLTNYNKTLLVTTIGVLVGAGISFGLAIFFFVTGKPQHQKISAENLLFMITLPEQSLLYEAKLSKDFTINDAVGELESIYIIDEYGLIVTPTSKYIVKGIKLERMIPEVSSKIHMNLMTDHPFREIIKEFNKYQRKKIVLDEQNQIKKIINIK